MADDLLKPTLTLKVGEGEAVEEFILRVPTPFERARLGVREAAIRRMMDPMAGDTVQIDPESWCIIRGMAVLEVLLEQASVKWPYTESKNAKGEPELVVDITKFPPGKEAVIAEVGLQFQGALDRFHSDRAGHTRSAVSEDVAGGGNSGSL